MANARMIKIGLPWPARTSPAFTTFALNQTTDQIETIFQAPAAIVISRLGFRFSIRTGTPPTYKISLQGVDTSGNADNTIKGGGSPASTTFTPPADSTWQNTWRWLNLDNSYTCARGEYLAWVIAYSSGTIDASNLATFVCAINNSGSVTNFPYTIQNDAGSRTRLTQIAEFGYGSSSQAYGTPLLSAQSQSITSTTEAGIAWTLTSGWGSTYQVVGVRFHATLAAGKTLTATIYTATGVGDTTVLQQVTLDTDFNAATATAGWFEIYFDETTLSTLSYGTAYRLSLVVDSGTNNFAGFTSAVAADCEAWNGGQLFASTSRAGGNWTDDATSRPLIELILDDISVLSGGLIWQIGP